MASTPRKVGLKTLVAGGEPGGGEPTVRAQIEDAFDAKVHEVLGLGELSISMFGEGPEQDGMSFLSRDYIHIQDVCRAMNFLCNKGELNQVYNIGTGIETPLFDCVADAKDILKSRSKIQRITPSEDYNQAIRFSLDCTKLHNLGFQPMLTLQEGLEDLCRDQKFCTPVRTLTVVK